MMTDKVFWSIKYNFFGAALCLSTLYVTGSHLIVPWQPPTSSCVIPKSTAAVSAEELKQELSCDGLNFQGTEHLPMMPTGCSAPWKQQNLTDCVFADSKNPKWSKNHLKIYINFSYSLIVKVRHLKSHPSGESTRLDNEHIMQAPPHQADPHPG